MISTIPLFDQESEIIHADCLLHMPTMDANSVDSIVTDPPYGISFMSREWDHGVPGLEFWVEALRVAKPGAHLLAFGGTRCHHRLMIAIEDAGWEIRDCLMWVYGSGFPKSMDVGKAMDKEAGAKREVVGSKITGKSRTNGDWLPGQMEVDITAPATDLAKAWDGWGTALKPAWEPIILARKPISESTIAKNVAKWGTGGLNIGACRVLSTDKISVGFGKSKRNGVNNCNEGWDRPWRKDGDYAGNKAEQSLEIANTSGRFPANLIHDGSDEVLAGFPSSKGSKPINRKEGFVRFNGKDYAGGAEYKTPPFTSTGYEDQGSAARFFYCPKASKTDRGIDNRHCTVKPTPLLQYLCRLITPPNGLVLDPFAGSGSTGKACKKEGFRFIGIEKEAEYCEIARRRVK